MFLTAEWRNVAMLNYAIDPVLIERLVPPGTELDFFEGKTYISLVGFQFLRTRLFGFRVPFHQDFEEVNLRFYVRRRKGDIVRRGVAFIREIVPKVAVATVARLAFGENYVSLPMSHDVAAGSAEYRWRYRQRWHSMRIEAREPASYPAEGSCEQFITEHYWGYSTLLEYEVEHEPWRVWTTKSARFEGDAAGLYGPQLALALNRQPDSAFLAEGSPVVVRRGRRIR